MLPALSLIGPVLDGLASVATDAVGKTITSIKRGPAASNITDSGTDFSAILSQVTNQAVDNLKTAEAASISGLQGKASVQQVVESMMTAQQSLQTAIAVRDKVVSAYQSISQMPI
ncbi:flagellar hook-basal body complex protein FliE [Beijerinckia indica]|uniref:Flagellar hook-basal body complex protein FliE n=1 Tax=Beijerinckia indica subsp. indica (strain ATCC 9039 / DSM 1715 / NCIMB 8712) TaxID=395963 RepID=B2IGW0_BEII9|nr:flagellar hook-basal body complex protein FliE [Beijerinckia indica]ACB97206.1 flagellar hook-basal body complex protein FliE [Beijerinckia indica subsp. indica ATCC 9039]